MIVRDIMTTGLVTVAPDDTLARAAGLLRRHQFHHLPVVREGNAGDPENAGPGTRKPLLLLEGVLTSYDIDMMAALAAQDGAAPIEQRPWQERMVVEVMHRALMRVTPTTSVAAAAQLLVERNLSYLPVVEYELVKDEHRAILVGLVTRSDLLIALSRAMGVFEPGMQLDVALSKGDVSSLARTLQLACELRITIRSIMAAPLEDGVPYVATLRLGTINPTPLLMRLREEGIQYSFGGLSVEGR